MRTGGAPPRAASLGSRSRGSTAHSPTPTTMSSLLRPLRLLALVLPLLLAAACASRRVSPDGTLEGESAESRGATVRVENQSIYETRVYIAQGSGRVRIGNASPNSTTVMRIAASYLAGGQRQIRFILERIASGTQPQVEDYPVAPGDVVTIVVRQ